MTSSTQAQKWSTSQVEMVEVLNLVQKEKKDNVKRKRFKICFNFFRH